VSSCENEPVTARAAEEEPSLATAESSGAESSSPAARLAASAAAANPEDEEPKPMFVGKFETLSKRTASSISARVRTRSITDSTRSRDRPSTSSPSIEIVSASTEPNDAVVVDADGAVQRLIES